MITALGVLAGCASADPVGSVTDSPGAPVGSSGKLLVYASFYPMYDFAAKIGGDRIELNIVVPTGSDPHDWEPTPVLIAGLEKAEVFIYNGAGMEHWVDTVLTSLQNKNLIVVETAADIPLLEDTHSHAAVIDRNQNYGHEHGQEHDDPDDQNHDGCEFDSHTWLNPQYAKKQMALIKSAFTTADPDNSDYYEANYDYYATELDKLDAEYKEELASLKNKVIVVSHEAYGYLCDAYGLVQVGIMGLQPDAEPTPARMAEVIDLVKAYNVGTIFFEKLAGPRVAEVIADATGAEVAALSPLEGLTETEIAEGDDYFSVMRKNLEALKKALES